MVLYLYNCKQLPLKCFHFERVEWATVLNAYRQFGEWGKAALQFQSSFRCDTIQWTDMHQKVENVLVEGGEWS